MISNTNYELKHSFFLKGEKTFVTLFITRYMAIMGVPAPTFSLGIKQFDETITNRYHQLSDEVGSMDLDYAMKYMRSFILAAKNIADNPAQPEWKKGDKYETAWKVLYQKPF